jgi:aryl-alcohol dehydrogenase-like predicted oxidoreductase
MQRRAFGTSGFRSSEIGLGTWQLGGNWGQVDEATAQATLDEAVAGGVNFLDTADVYGDGLSEQRIARFLKRHRGGPLFVATKLGRRGDPGWPANFTREAMRRHTEDSLRRLEVDVLDLTQLHCVPTDVLREGAVFDHLRGLQDDGKIRAWGASVESMDEAQICLRQPRLASLQIIFNVFRQKPIDTLFADAKARGVALIVRLPLASGLLAGKFTKHSRFPAEDHRNFNRDGQSFNVGETFAGLPFAKGVDLADALRPFVPAGWSMARFALRWILDFDAVSVIIPGAKSPAQARENSVASDLPPLPPEVHAKLREFYRSQVHAHIRGPY